MFDKFEIYYGLKAGVAALPEVRVFNQIATEGIAGTGPVPIDVAFKQSLKALLQTTDSEIGYVEALLPYRTESSFKFDTLPFADSFIFDIQLTNTPRRLFINPVADSKGIGRGTSVWNFAANYIDVSLTEVFCKFEIATDGKFLPIIVYRDKPFYSPVKGPLNKNEWIGENGNVELTKITRPREHFTSRRLSVTNNFLKNIFVIKNPLAQEDLQAELIWGSAFDRESVERFGARIDQRDVRVLCFDEDDATKGIAKYRTLVRDYNMLNHLFSSGRMDCAGADFELTVGSKLTVTDESRKTEEQFYIETVEHSWTSYGGGFHTKIGVTRGFRGEYGTSDLELANLTDRYVERFAEVTEDNNAPGAVDDAVLNTLIESSGDVHPVCIWPTVGRTVTSDFGGRIHPLRGIWSNHKGIDIDGRTGDSIFAVAAGEIRTTGTDSGRGNYVIIDHGQGVSSHYFHLNTFASIATAGASVVQGATIGTMGATGAVNGDHLHIEMHINGVAKNPDIWLRPERVIKPPPRQKPPAGETSKTEITERE
jgi:murein DD-endopeptidase MepM/ murein hydrolase activator NlpD